MSILTTSRIQAKTSENYAKKQDKWSKRVSRSRHLPLTLHPPTFHQAARLQKLSHSQKNHSIAKNRCFHLTLEQLIIHQCYLNQLKMIDSSISSQNFIEDCETCCNPLEFNLTTEYNYLISFSVEPIGQ